MTHGVFPVRVRSPGRTPTSTACWSSRSSPGRRTSITPSSSGRATRASTARSATGTIADRSNLLGSDATLARIAGSIQAGMAAGRSTEPDRHAGARPGDRCGLFRCRWRNGSSSTSSPRTCQDEWVLADRLRLVPGLRYDHHHSVFGSRRLAEDVAAVRSRAPTTRVRTSAGRALSRAEPVRAVRQRRLPRTDSRTAEPGSGPEHITSFDAGIQHEVSRAFRAR